MCTYMTSCTPCTYAELVRQHVHVYTLKLISPHSKYTVCKYYLHKTTDRLLNEPFLQNSLPKRMNCTTAYHQHVGSTKFARGGGRQGEEG